MQSYLASEFLFLYPQRRRQAVMYIGTTDRCYSSKPSFLTNYFRARSAVAVFAVLPLYLSGCRYLTG